MARLKKGHLRFSLWQSGMSLVELLVALGMLAIAVVGFVQLSNSLDQGRAGDATRLRAQWAAQGVADAISTLDHDTLAAYIKAAPASALNAASVTTPPLSLSWLAGWQNGGLSAVTIRFDLKKPDGTPLPLAAYATSDVASGNFDIQLAVSVSYRRWLATPVQTLTWNKKVDPR